MGREESHENAKQAQHWTHVIGVRKGGSRVEIGHLVGFFVFGEPHEALSEAEAMAGDVL